MIALIRTILLGRRRSYGLLQYLGIAGGIALMSIIATSVSLGEGDRIMTALWINLSEITALIIILLIVTTARYKARSSEIINLLTTHHLTKAQSYMGYMLAYMIQIIVLYIILWTIANLTIILSNYNRLPNIHLARTVSLIKMLSLVGLAWFLSAITSGIITSLVTLLIYIIGHSTGFMMYIGQQQGGLIERLGVLAYYTFPNYQALDNHAILAQTSNPLALGIGICIIILYTILTLWIGSRLIQRQEF